MGDGYDRALEALVPAVESIKVGDPASDPELDMGPMVSRAQQERVSGFVDRARGAPAPRSRPAASRSATAATSIRPSLVTGVAQDAEIVQSEVFGPVVTVQRFADEAEGIALGQRRAVRAGGIGLDEGRQARAARGEGAALRHGLDQRPPHDRVRDAARRLRPVRLRQGHEQLLDRGLHRSSST